MSNRDELTEEQKFEKRKLNIIRAALDQIMQEEVTDYIKTGDYKSIEELDEHIGKMLTEYNNTIDQIKSFYISKIYS